MLGEKTKIKQMANFTISNKVQAQIRLNERFQKPEMRAGLSPILRLGNGGAQSLFPDMPTIRSREDKAISAYMMTRNARSTMGVARAALHTGPSGDSGKVDLSWTTFTDKFSMSVERFENNVIGFEDALANGLAQAIANIRSDAETWLAGLLFADRTQVNVATQNGSFNATNFAFEIAVTDKMRQWQLIKSMMGQNNYEGQFDVIANPTAYANAMFYANQGGGNSTNTGFQFNDMNFVQSNGLDDANYTGGVSLVMPAGTFAVLDWIPRKNREGLGASESAIGVFTTIVDPVTGITFALSSYMTRADTSAANGGTQDVVIQFEVSVDLSANLAPLSNANETVVYEVAQLNADA